MFDFLAPLFRSKVTRPRTKPRRLMLEEFETRLVPSTSHVVHHAAVHHAAVTHHAPASHSAKVVHTAASTSATGTTTTTSTGALTANLVGNSSNELGTATFTPGTTAGTNTLTLTASGLAASSTFAIEVDGTSVGSVTTDASGNANTTLTNITATVAQGSKVTVVDTTTTPSTTLLTGSFGSGDSDGDGEHHQGGSGFGSLLSGAIGTSGTAFFHADTTTTNGLTVRVAGLTANTTYTVEIGSASVGTFTTDANGNARTSLSNITPTITSGSTTISILDATNTAVLTGTFTSVQFGFGGSGFGESHGGGGDC